MFVTTTLMLLLAATALVRADGHLAGGGGEPGEAQVRLVHAIAGVPVDVWVDGGAAKRGFQPFDTFTAT